MSYVKAQTRAVANGCDKTVTTVEYILSIFFGDFNIFYYILSIFYEGR